MSREPLTLRSPFQAVKYLGIHLSMEGDVRAHTAYLNGKVQKILAALGYKHTATMAKAKLQVYWDTPSTASQSLPI